MDFNDLLTPTMAAVNYLRSVRGLKFNTNEVTIHSFAGVSHSKPLLLNRCEYIAATNKIRLFYRQDTTKAFALEDLLTKKFLKKFYAIRYVSLGLLLHGCIFNFGPKRSSITWGIFLVYQIE